VTLLDVSISARKDRRDPYSPLEFEPDPPFAIRRPGDPMPMLTDNKQHATVERFMQLMPKSRRAGYLDAVMMRLAGGRVGDSAVHVACVVAASDYVSNEVLHRHGLIVVDSKGAVRWALTEARRAPGGS
jgi:hypothetical protein